MLTDLVEEGANEILRILDNLDTFLEALRFVDLSSRDNTIPLNRLGVIRRSDLHIKRGAQGFLDESRRFTSGAQSLEMTECLNDPVPDLAIGLEAFDVRTARDEGSVKHRRALSVILVVGDHALGR